MPKKVFLSHASEDKERFVIDFATRLRENGVNVWLDEWEMLPGDSLVDKIFEEGLKEADSVIIVLSNFSVIKPWVHEELNASVVKRISKGTKIIPVVIDDCEVPESLSSIVWEKINDLRNYDESFKRITSSIFDLKEKPPIGSVPAHVTTRSYKNVEGITKADNLVLKKSCDYALEKNARVINPEKLFSDGNDFDISQSEIKDCIEILGDIGYLEITRTSVRNFEDFNCYYRVTPIGFNKYGIAYLKEYSSIVDKIISAIVNEEVRVNLELERKLKQPIYLINQVLDLLKLNGHLDLVKTVVGGVHITRVSASLRRVLDK